MNRQQLQDHRLLSYGTWLLRSYIDLSAPPLAAPLHAKGVYHAFRHMRDGLAPVSFQISPPNGIRDTILRHCGGAPGIDVRISAERRLNNNWTLVHETIADAKALSDVQRLKVTMLLGKLGMYNEVLKLPGDYSESEIADSPAIARIALRQCQARAAMKPRLRAAQNRLTAKVAVLSRSVEVRIMALLTLVVHYGKHELNIQALDQYGSKLLDELRKLEPEKYSPDCLIASKGYRALAFIPFHKGERSKVREYLHLAEVYCDAIPSGISYGTELQEENRHPLLETLVKEAEWIGDRDRALELAQQLVRLDGGDPKVRLQIGEILMGHGKYADALREFSIACRLGPPLSAISHYKLGKCQELLGDISGAISSYIRSIDFEQRNPLALLRLRRLLLLTDEQDLLYWCDSTLEYFRNGNSGRTNLNIRPDRFGEKSIRAHS